MIDLLFFILLDKHFNFVLLPYFIEMLVRVSVALKEKMQCDTQRQLVPLNDF